MLKKSNYFSIKPDQDEVELQSALKGDNDEEESGDEDEDGSEAEEDADDDTHKNDEDINSEADDGDEESEEDSYDDLGVSHRGSSVILFLILPPIGTHSVELGSL